MFLERPPEGQPGVSHERCCGATPAFLPQSSMSERAAEPGATIFVCVTCRNAEEEGVRPGKILFDALQARLKCRAGGDVALQAVECLSVCKRPCTVALAGAGKWTYVVGDLDIEANAEDIIEAAAKFAATSDGLIPWRERPKSFRKGVVCARPALVSAHRGSLICSAKFPSPS